MADALWMNFPTDDDDDEVMFLVTLAAIEVVASAITDPPDMALPNMPSNCSRGYIAIWPTRRAAVAACGNAPRMSIAKWARRIPECFPCQSCCVLDNQVVQSNRSDVDGTRALGRYLGGEIESHFRNERGLGESDATAVFTASWRRLKEARCVAWGL